MCKILYYFFKQRWSELDIPIVDDVYYEFTKSSEKFEDFGVLPQRYWHKNWRTVFTTHFSRKEKEYGKRGLDEQLERSLYISEDENQRDKISKGGVE